MGSFSTRTAYLRFIHFMNIQKLTRLLLTSLVVTTSLSRADSVPEASAQDTKKMVQNNFVETAQKGVKLSGYVDAGYSYNFTGTGNNSMV